jgi:selenide,water dikinase
VTGTVHPKRLVVNSEARPGDKLILTKPLGTGVIGTAVKVGKAPEAVAAQVAQSMATLNKEASALMQEAGVHAATDVTGFGLMGHTSEVAVNSGVGINLFSGEIPLFPEVEKLAEQGMRPGGLMRNRDFYSASVEIGQDVPAARQDILFDPQTSGGLLISLPAAKAEALLDSLHRAGIKDAAIIGEVVSEPKGIIAVS